MLRRALLVSTCIYATLLCPAALAASQDEWTGVDVGAQVGGAFGNSQKDSSAGDTPSFGVNGVIGGGTIGYSQQWGNIVLGLEGDFSADSGSGDAACVLGASTCHASNRWLGTVRPRVGYAFGDILPYVTGGIAFGDIHAWKTQDSTGDTTTSETTTETGWAVGAGLEDKLTTNWSMNLEYLYVSFNDASFTGPLGPYKQTLDENIVRVGVNYTF